MLTKSETLQLLRPERVHHRVHPVPPGHRRGALGSETRHDPPHPRLPCAGGLVAGRRRQHPRRQRRRQEQGRHRRLPPRPILPGPGLSLLHQLEAGATLEQGSFFECRYYPATKLNIETKSHQDVHSREESTKRKGVEAIRGAMGLNRAVSYSIILGRVIK